VVFYKEVRWHGRGGQGAVTSAELLASAAVKNGLYAVSIPFFGAERRGAHVFAFNRISDKPILLKSMIKTPDYVIVLDSKLLKLKEHREKVLGGLKENSILVVNATEEELKDLKWSKVAFVDATEIVLKHGLVLAGIPLTNTAMLGAFAKIFEKIPPEKYEESIEDKWGRKKAEINIEVFREGYRNVRWMR